VSSASSSPVSGRAQLEVLLRGALLEPAHAVTLEVYGDMQAAVLVALYVGGGEIHAVFTRRRDDLRRHAGEISFPGGRRDDDDPDLLHTALREADEEIGLPPDAVTVVGALEPTPTIATGYAIYPFVGLIDPGQAWAVQTTEVAEVLELSLASLRTGYDTRPVTRRGMTFMTDTYVVGDVFIWGATARIVGDLLARIPA
jgi:8-oxo-dGTP pyrophosphatase MutT (NUDIX family)